MLFDTFSLGSWQHIVSLILGILISFGFYKIALKKSDKFYAYLVLFLYLSWWLVRVLVLSHQDFYDNLPLQLCDITQLLCVFALFNKNDKIFNFLYFTAVGALIAILTPTVTGTFGLLTLVNFFFYVTHITNFFVITYLIKKHDKRIFKNDWKTSFVILMLLGTWSLFINTLLDTNFMYVSYPIDNPIVNMLGEWPYYLIGFAVLAASLFYLFEKITLYFYSRHK